MRPSKRRHNQPPAPADNNGQQKGTLVSVKTAWQGPLPSPKTLEEFEEIVPGSAKAIIDEWQAETNHRRTFERKALNAQIIENIGGRVLAFVFALTALGVAVYLAMIHAEWAAGIIGAGTIGSVVYSLVSGRRQKDD